MAKSKVTRPKKSKKASGSASSQAKDPKKTASQKEAPSAPKFLRDGRMSKKSKFTG